MITFNLGIWQLVYIIFTVLSLIIIIIDHGKETKINAYASFIGTIIVLFILYMGGFFNQ